MRTPVETCLWLLAITAGSCSSLACAGPEPLGRTKGKFYVVGTGPAGPDLATLRAPAAIKKADAYLSSPSTRGLFRQYLAGKEFMGDPWEGMFDYRGKPYRELDEAGAKNWRESRIGIRDRIVAKIKTRLEMGKNVALLDGGDP